MIKKRVIISWKPIIFSDILLIPYALDQKVEFKKNFGPKLGELNVDSLLNISDTEITEKLNPVYKLIKETCKDKTLTTKDLIGFVGGTWTLLVYMLNKKSPKKLNKGIPSPKFVCEKIKSVSILDDKLDYYFN